MTKIIYVDSLPVEDGYLIDTVVLRRKARIYLSAEELKNLNIYTTPSLYEITLPDTNGKLWHINQDGLVW